ncbi:hypothetical protein LDENG_00243670 [Lucifuga dentata]|nr:hypothetical protein LDENG_00243670 [Lucifuga dentata]
MLAGSFSPQEERVAAAAGDRLPLREAAESSVESFQDVEPMDGSASEETDSREMCERRDRQPETERETDCPPAAGPSRKEWLPGAPCRAVYTEDGLVYPAVVVWVRGQRCLVRFDFYGNEEEQDVNDLLSPSELNGPAKAAAAAKGFDWKRRVGEERDKRPSSPQKKEKSVNNQKRTENLQKDKEKPQNVFCLFPPFPPPPIIKEHVAFVAPPPPPLWAFGGKEPSGTPDTDITSTWLSSGPDPPTTERTSDRKSVTSRILGDEAERSS